METSKILNIKSFLVAFREGFGVKDVGAFLLSLGLKCCVALGSLRIQDVSPPLGVSADPGNLLEMHIPPSKSESLGMVPWALCFNKPPCYWGTDKFGKP